MCVCTCVHTYVRGRTCERDRTVQSWCIQLTPLPSPAVTHPVVIIKAASSNTYQPWLTGRRCAQHFVRVNSFHLHKDPHRHGLSSQPCSETKRLQEVMGFGPWVMCLGAKFIPTALFWEGPPGQSPQGCRNYKTPSTRLKNKWNKPYNFNVKCI